MKQVKFRRPHYDRKGNFSHFSYWGKINFNKDFSESSFTSPTFNSKCTYKEDEQFTGLKDCKDIDIYEGDIVNPFTDQQEYAQIIFMNGGFKIATKRKSGNYLIWNYNKEEAEVIGNIHENQKLRKHENLQPREL